MFITVDWESCDEEEAELDDTDKAKARRYGLKLHSDIHTMSYTHTHTYIHIMYMGHLFTSVTMYLHTLNKHE